MRSDQGVVNRIIDTSPLRDIEEFSQLSEQLTNALTAMAHMIFSGVFYSFPLNTEAKQHKPNSYFHLNPNSPTIEGTIVTLGTNTYLPLDPTGIPTGSIEPYPSIKPNNPFTLGASEPDLDDCFLMNAHPSSIPLDTRPLPLRTLATLYDPSTSLHLQVQSTEPAFQFYTGKYIDVPELTTEDGQKVAGRGPRSGLCVEPSRYVNCAGREEWKGMCLLRRGEVWGARSVYVAWQE